MCVNSVHIAGNSHPGQAVEQRFCSRQSVVMHGQAPVSSQSEGEYLTCTHMLQLQQSVQESLGFPAARSDPCMATWEDV